jgi:hypothetical protein
MLTNAERKQPLGSNFIAAVSQNGELKRGSFVCILGPGQCRPPAYRSNFDGGETDDLVLAGPLGSIPRLISGIQEPAERFIFPPTVATPMLTVIDIFPTLVSKSLLPISLQRRAPAAWGCSGSISGRRIANASPPYWHSRSGQRPAGRPAQKA